MFKTFLFGVSIVASAVCSGGTAYADTQKGRCVVTVTAHGGKNFALLKCDRANFPGDYIIRSQIWQHEDKAGYNKLARFAGRRFTCDITYDTTTRRGMVESNMYSLKNCR